MRKIIVISLIAILIFAFSACADNEIASIELGVDSISTVEGVNISIPVTGYDEKVNKVANELLYETGLVWMYETDTDSFTVYDGVLTPTAPGTGTVWVECENSNIKSQKIEVLVKETDVSDEALESVTYVFDGKEYTSEELWEITGAKYMKVDVIFAGAGAEVDWSDEAESTEYPHYFPVIDERFQTISEMKTYIESLITYNLAATTYYHAFEGA